jgi:hypothetical protein
VDVFALSRTYSKADLLAWTGDLTPGFDLSYFVEALDTLPRYTDLDLSLGGVEVAALRVFFSEWADELRQNRS